MSGETPDMHKYTDMQHSQQLLPRRQASAASHVMAACAHPTVESPPHPFYTHTTQQIRKQIRNTANQDPDTKCSTAACICL